MGIYSLSLVGSNYFAPVICGFIAQYQGWQWAFFWPSIFLAAAFVFLFFLMEETNFVRDGHGGFGNTTTIVPQTPMKNSGSTAGSDVTEKVSREGEADVEKADKGLAGYSAREQLEDETTNRAEVGVVHDKKSYIQKLALLGPRQPRNNMLRRAWQSVYYLTWPVIFYAGLVKSRVLVLVKLGLIDTRSGSLMDRI